MAEKRSSSSIRKAKEDPPNVGRMLGIGDVGAPVQPLHAAGNADRLVEGLIEHVIRRYDLDHGEEHESDARKSVRQQQSVILTSPAVLRSSLGAGAAVSEFLPVQLQGFDLFLRWLGGSCP